MREMHTATPTPEHRQVSINMIAPVMGKPSKNNRRLVFGLVGGIGLIGVIISLFVVLSADSGFYFHYFFGPSISVITPRYQSSKIFVEKKVDQLVSQYKTGTAFVGKKIDQAVEGALPKSEYVIATAYRAGTPMVVKKAVLKKPGFLVVNPVTELGIETETIMGHSAWLPAGNLTNIPIKFSFDPLVSDYIQISGKQLFVAIYHDDGDAYLSFDQDTILRGYKGVLVGAYVQVQ